MLNPKSIEIQESNSLIKFSSIKKRYFWNMKLTLVTLFSFISILLQAQSSSDIVTWKFSAEKIKNNGNDNAYNLFFDAKIKDGWHLYSQLIDGDGPIPTTFIFNSNKSYETIDGIEESESIKKFDPNFDMEISFFEKEAKFVQIIHLVNKELKSITGTVEFMVCNDKMCYPPDVITFNFDIK